MYTIDEMIERLKELREIAPDGGKTVVVVYSQDGTADASLEFAAAELQHCKVTDSGVYVVDDEENEITVLTIF